MSWVRTAVENVKLQGYERLHQTVYGGYGTKPDVFWALDPYDMPEELKENVEETVKDDGSSEATCAIIRMETLPAFDDEELRESGNPLACFVVYMGTDPSTVEYTRRINIYEEKRPETPPPNVKDLTDANGIPISRLKRLSVNLGWSDPYALYNKTSTGETSPVRRRMTLQAGWTDRTRRRSSSIRETKSGLPSPTSPTYPAGGRRISAPGRRMKRMSMFPALSNVSENDTKASPAPTTPPTVHEIEVASTSSPKPSLEARPSGDGKVRTRKPKKRMTTSSVVRERKSEMRDTASQSRTSRRPSTSAGVGSKRESATEAALLALEGRGSAGAAAADHDDIPQYLIDAQRGLAPPAAHGSSTSRPASPGRVDAAVRKLKTLSLSAVGRGSPDIRCDLAEDSPARQSPPRSLHQRIDAASRKLKTLSMASLGMDISPVREAEVVETPDVVVSAPEAEPEVTSVARPPRVETPPAKRRTLFFGTARNQTDSDGETSSAHSKLSKLKKTPPKGSPSDKGVVPVDSAVASVASIPSKPQGQAVSRIRDAAEVKRASRMKRFSTHISRMFN